MKKIIFGLLVAGLILVISVVVYFGFKYYQLSTNVVDSNNQPVLILEEEKNSELKEYSLVAAASGQTALELLVSAQEVELTQYDFGAMISAINGLAADKSFYWAFYVNGEYATQAADKTVLAEGDIVEFKYEKIEAFPSK